MSAKESYFTISNWQEKALFSRNKYKVFLKYADPKKLLPKLVLLHQEAFRRISCNECAACCKGYSPRFKSHDIRNLSRFLKIKKYKFIDKYLTTDEDHDYVLQSLPCPFLDEDLRCIVYDERPSDCRKYPYTDNLVFFTKVDITLKNVTICPAAFYVMEKLMSS